jgi:hypothetical protein
MRSSYRVALMSVPLGLLLMGCCHHPPHDHSSGGGVIQPGENARTSSPPSCTPPPSGVNGPQAKVTPGKYCVCNIAVHEVHEKHEAKHLEVNEIVEIGALDFVTQVQLGASQVQMTRFGDDQELSALMSYRHKNNQTQGFETVTHLVRIAPADPMVPVRGCDNTKNVLRISFCFSRTAGGWACGKVPGGHLGDTHVQN